MGYVVSFLCFVTVSILFTWCNKFWSPLQVMGPMLISQLSLFSNSLFRPRHGVSISSNSGNDPSVLSSDWVAVNGSSLLKKKEKIGSSVGKENGNLSSIVGKKKKGEVAALKKLEVLYEDGFGTASMEDYLDIARDLIKPDGGPPRWFSPIEAGPPLEGSPLLLFLPGMDGVGLGLIMHQKNLGKVFEVRCLHIPIHDRTPFEGLVKFVEGTVKQEHALSPNRPIYLVGDSFGGCLALTVASRNTTIDLVLILSNPATSLDRSPLKPLFPLLEALPIELHFTVTYLLSFLMGKPGKMAKPNADTIIPPAQMLRQLYANLVTFLPRLSVLSDIIPRDALLWKMKLLKSAADYTNSRLHAVKAEVLLLASGNDNMLPSGEEAKRLSSLLKNCIIRNFGDNGHTLLLEDGINLLTVIKGTSKYRRSRRHDYVSDFLPPSMLEFKDASNQYSGMCFLVSPKMFSTLNDGTIVNGLAGVPDEGPVILVGYHMLMGLELTCMVDGFLREKNIMIHGLAHPHIFSESLENASSTFSYFDCAKVFGAVPVSASNLFKLLARKSHVLVYPGGPREALHRKGEAYKLFWPDKPEIVRMAARFGATIVPFGAVGEDDIVELVLDYNDLVRIPVVSDYVKDFGRNAPRVRDGMSGEVANEDLFIPGVLPKIPPGRFYYLFGKPIKTRGKEAMLKDTKIAEELYAHVKSEVETCMGYLLKKREQDPYRNLVDRTIYRMISAPPEDVPSFTP